MWVGEEKACRLLSFTDGKATTEGAKASGHDEKNGDIVISSSTPHTVTLLTYRFNKCFPSFLPTVTCKPLTFWCCGYGRLHRKDVFIHTANSFVCVVVVVLFLFCSSARCNSIYIYNRKCNKRGKERREALFAVFCPLCSCVYVRCFSFGFQPFFQLRCAG